MVGWLVGGCESEMGWSDRENVCIFDGISCGIGGNGGDGGDGSQTNNGHLGFRLIVLRNSFELVCFFQMQPLALLTVSIKIQIQPFHSMLVLSNGTKMDMQKENLWTWWNVRFSSVQFGLCVYVAVYLNTKSNKPEAMKIQKENRHVENALCNRLHYARFNL